MAHAASSSSPGILLELLLPQLAGCSSLLRGSRALGMGCHQTESTQVSKCHLSNHLCPEDFQAEPSSAPGLVWAGCLPPTEDVHSPLSRDARAPWRVTPWYRRSLPAARKVSLSLQKPLWSYLVIAAPPRGRCSSLRRRARSHGGHVPIWEGWRGGCRGGAGTEAGGTCRIPLPKPGEEPLSRAMSRAVRGPKPSHSVMWLQILT